MSFNLSNVEVRSRNPVLKSFDENVIVPSGITNSYNRDVLFLVDRLLRETDHSIKTVKTYSKYLEKQTEEKRNEYLRQKRNPKNWLKKKTSLRSLKREIHQLNSTTNHFNFYSNTEKEKLKFLQSVKSCLCKEERMNKKKTKAMENFTNIISVYVENNEGLVESLRDSEKTIKSLKADLENMTKLLFDKSDLQKSLQRTLEAKNVENNDILAKLMRKTKEADKILNTLNLKDEEAKEAQGLITKLQTWVEELQKRNSEMEAESETAKEGIDKLIAMSEKLGETLKGLCAKSQDMLEKEQAEVLA